ncbi:MAG: hypothetical protein Q7T55_24235, partial [Solirubrobacteraceae bacterium]|nr:hypothetical protein [Solirubrobacteraceae bacterium]
MRHRRLLLGIPVTAVTALTAAAVAIGAPGDNDTSYGSKGIAQLPTGNGGRSSAEASVLQGDKLVVVGQARADTGAGLRAELAITRLNADGSRDATFGTNGETLVAAGTGESEALAVTVAPDGKIVAAGRAVDGPATKLAVVRLSANGIPDPTFGGAGLVLLNRGNAGVAAVEGVAAEADGRVVVASTVVDGGANKISLARLSPGGVSEAWGGLTAAGSGADTRAAGLVRLPGDLYGVVGRAEEGGDTKLLVARYAAATGALTGGWGNKGNGVSLLAA